MSSFKSYAAVTTDTWIACGKCATSFGLIALAMKAFEQALFHDNTNPSALCGLSYCLRIQDSNVNQTLGCQKAIDILTHALEFNKLLASNSDILKELTECYLFVGLNEQAHQTIQSAIQSNENDPSLWLLSAQTLIRAGTRHLAEQALQHCLSLLPQHKSNEANKQEMDPETIETARAAHAELAAIAAADGNIELSITELTATLSLPPPPLSRREEHVALWCALVTAKERDNDIPGAIQACEQAEIAVGNSQRILMTHAYLLLLLVNQDNTESASYVELAIALLSRIVDLDKERESTTTNPNGDFLPWYLLGKAYSLLDQPRLAYDAYQVALRNASNSPMTWLAVGKLYLELKQLPDALAAYSQALRLQMEEGSPGTATAWEGLSCVYERCDDQLMDASDACTRSAACYKAIGDLKQAKVFEDRADALAKASKKEAPAPPLRNPPDVPAYLLRDLVALMPNERIEYIHGLANQLQQEQNQQQAQVEQQRALSGQPQQAPQSSPQVLEAQGQQAPSQSPNYPPPLQMYPMLENYKGKSPQAPPMPLAPPQWHNQLPPPPPPPQNAVPNPYYYQQPPPPQNLGGAPMYRSPNQPMVQMGHFQGPPPPPPGYYGYPVHAYPQPMYR